MARSDLLIALAEAGTTGDVAAARSATEAIIAEERAKQHNVLADRLSRTVKTNGHARPTMDSVSSRGGGGKREYVVEVMPRRQLDDLVLPTEVRHAINQLVEEQRRASVLRAHGIEPRHRVLLVGPPGTGKTSVAEAIAEAIAIPLLVVRYEMMIGSYLGETAMRMRYVFDYARTTPCVLFFDEFDAIGKERGDIHETGEIKRVVTSLLMQMDDLPSYTLVVGATNHPELLDRASWRRFQLRLSLPMPTKKATSEYIAQFFEQLDEPLGHSPATLANRLGKLSFAELEQFCIDIRRRYVLAMGCESLKTIVSDQLSIWTARAEAQGTRRKRTTNGRSTPTDSSDS